MTSIDSPGYSEEPVGGGAESIPDPTPPSRPDRDPAEPDADALNSPDPTADSEEIGGPGTVAANDELDGEVER